MEPRRPPRSLRNVVLCVLCGLCGFFLSRGTGADAAEAGGGRHSAGTFVLDLDPAAAPNQTAYFMKLAAEGAYDGTTFHRAVKYGMVQGGDPLTKDPAKRALYGTGGQNAVKAEARAPKMTRGSVAAVLVPGKPDSAGVAVLHRARRSAGARQPVHRVRARRRRHRGAAEDLRDAGRRQGRRDRAGRDPPRDDSRYAGRAIRHRDRRRTRRATAPCSIRAPGRSRSSSSSTRRPTPFASSCGSRPRASTTAWRSTASRPGFVIQTGALSSRTAPLTAKQQALVHNLPPEFNDTKHVKGIVSMARGDAPDSATTSFFICTGAVGGARRRLHCVRTGG